MKLNCRTKRKWLIFKTGAISLSIIVAIVFAVGNIGKVHAVGALSSDDIGTYKQNVLYKAIYANLKKCYTQMSTPISESASNTAASYDSTTYFASTALDSSYLKFPDGVGEKNESSCPGMIMGWSTSWIVNLFTHTGDYDGLAKLNTDAEVPDGGWFNSSVDKMGTFLQNIGYTKEETGEDFDGRKCFYIKATFNQDVLNNYWMPTPANGWEFETIDYCIKTDASGNLPIAGDTIDGLLGNNEYFNSEYDNGHLTDDSNIIFVYYDEYMRLIPGFMHWNGTFTSDSGSYLNARLDGIDFRYPAVDSYSGETYIEGTTINPQTISSNSDATNSEYCWGLGYTICGYYWEGFVTWRFGSFTTENNTISYSDFKDKMVNLIRLAKDDYGYYLFSNVSPVDYSPISRTYYKGNSDATYISYFLKDVSSYNDGVYNDAEKYILYWNYLRDHYNVASTESEVPGAILVSWLQDDGTFAKRYIYDPDADTSDKRYVLDSAGKWDGTTMQDWEWIAQQLALIDVENAFAVEVAPIVDPSITTTTTGSGGDDESQTNKLEEACYQEAKSLGWIICPMIFGLREVSESIYSFIEPLIQVNETTVSQLGNQQSNLFKAWNTFRGFANIIFVILFLFIIFSQLTGWGIDNYGIKKMLPKLIIVAILVNVSFIICAIAVDTSNIVGKGIEGLFENIGGTITMRDVTQAETGAISGTVSVNTAVGAQSHIVGEVVSWLVLVAGGVVVGAAFSGWAIIIPILLFLLTTIISIIFAMIILGLRQAMVIILIVLSPVAFACSVLPNTEPIFKKWFNVFKAILMVYPIVGALIGAGYFTASLIYKGGNEGTDLIMTIVAGLLSVIPYFLIPSLTKKSLDGVGMLGTKLSGLGKSLGTGAKNGINNTDAVRNAKADSRAANKAFGSKLYMNTFGKKTAKDIADGKKVSTRRANRYTRAAELANTNKQSRINARSAMSQYNRLNSESGFQAAMSAANMAEDATAVKNYETMISAGDFKLDDGTKLDSQNNESIAKALQAELQKTESNGYDANKVRALTNALAAKGKEGRSLMYNAVSNAQTQGRGASRQAIKDFSSNIMNNHAGTMKEKHRSLYEFAKATAGLDASAAGSADSISNFASSGIGSLTAADMTNMDIQQLQRYRENVSGNDTQTLAQLAQSALSDEHLSKDLSEKTRTELEKIAQQGGYTPPAHSSNGGLSGDSGKIHTAAAQDSQQLTATQAAAQIQNAVNNNRSVASTDPLVQKAEQDALNAIKSGAADAAPKNVILGPDGKPLSRK